VPSEGEVGLRVEDGSLEPGVQAPRREEQVVDCSIREREKSGRTKLDNFADVLTNFEDNGSGGYVHTVTFSDRFVLSQVHPHEPSALCR
jgi:hypothetical protein